MAVYLTQILDWHRQRARQDTRDLAQLREAAQAASSAAPSSAAANSAAPSAKTPPPAAFSQALLNAKQSGPGGVIAEIKRRSPSKGDLRPNLDPQQLAGDYQVAGASCVSVLTDAHFFGGSPDDLTQARSGCRLPILRKDFTVDAKDICDARLMGASAVLLIVSALEPQELADFIELATELGLDALVETHDRAEIELAGDAGAKMVGVNQRDLNTFEVNRNLALELLEFLPADAVRVAESAIRDAADARRLFVAGYHAVLVGESFVTAPDPKAEVEKFVAELEQAD